ncbi:unnamed protein product [Lampetra planeri]
MGVPHRVPLQSSFRQQCLDGDPRERAGGRPRGRAGDPAGGRVGHRAGGRATVALDRIARVRAALAEGARSPQLRGSGSRVPAAAVASAAAAAPRGPTKSAAPLSVSAKY